MSLTQARTNWIIFFNELEPDRWIYSETIVSDWTRLYTLSHNWIENTGKKAHSGSIVSVKNPDDRLSNDIA